MNKKMIWLAAVTLFASVGQVSYAAEAKMAVDKHESCGCSKNFAMKLDLTADQKAKIKVIMEQSHKDTMAQRKAMQPIKEQMRAMITSDTIDQSKLDTLISQKMEIVSSMMKNKIMVKHQIYLLLTPQQKVKFNEMMMKWDQKMMDRMAKHEKAMM